MHRRPLAPTRARSAAWALRLAMSAAVVALVAILAAHHPKVTSEAALFTLALALGCASLAVLCGLRAMRTIWRTGQPGLGQALFGLLLATVTLAYPGSLAVVAARAPLVMAASTDPERPPAPSRSTRAAAARGALASLESPVGAVKSGEPITLDMPAGDAFDTVEDAVRALHWHVIDSVPPGGRLGLGHLDAVAFSPLMHLPQDIAIRVTPLGGQTRVDVLSAARLGITDFGGGAATIRQLGEAVAAQLDD